LLANQSINGLLHKDRVKLAFIASYKNKTLLKQYSETFESWFTKKEMEDIRVAGTLAKLASALDSSKRAIVEKVELEKGSTDSLQLLVHYKDHAFVEKYETEKHIRQLEKALNKTIGLKFIPIQS
jgi:exopolyphosphatase / guanosine-5'-triphosphate,3'-diphosphate pyrophosphatase